MNMFNLCHVKTQTEHQNIHRSGRWSGGFGPLPAFVPTPQPTAHAPLNQTFGPLCSVFHSAHMLWTSREGITTTTYLLNTFSPYYGL